MQVYACVFTRAGDFLIGTKPMMGYFFSNGLRPRGKPLHGGGDDALPGGAKHDEESIGQGAAREFWEETRASILLQSFFSSETLDGGRDRHGQQVFFGAGYFLVGSADLGVITATVAANLNAGNAAAQAVQNCTITTLAQLRQTYPSAPEDNELDSIQVMNVVRDWGTIDSWQYNNEVNWYYKILLHLKGIVLGEDSELETGPASVG